MNFKTLKTGLFILLLVICSNFMSAQEASTESDSTMTSDTAKKKEDKMEKMLKPTSEFPGLFMIYRDTTKGSIYMMVSEDQLDKEYIFFSQVENGTLDAGLFKGAYRSSKVFKIEKDFDKLRFVQQNTGFYFDPENPLSKASNANISEGTLASVKIEASKDGNYLVKADNLFKKETFSQIKPSYSSSYKGFKLGSLSSDKTRIEQINNYEDNLNVLTEFVYSGTTSKRTSEAVTDRRNVSVLVFQMIIEMPDNDYEPRYDDARVGYFMDQVDDQTTTETVNYRDMIHRWHLVKKDPTANLSEPIEPITWWIENTTPMHFRETIKQGVLEWNKAFEKIGFKDVMVVKVQPDDAEWDAGDIRYNVLRWTSSPQPPFGGYGPSFANPRTGQLLGADIMLEYVHHTNRVFYDELLLGESALHEQLNNDPHYCSFGHSIQSGVQFGRALVMGKPNAAQELSKMQKDAMLELVMHEVGHTLGLNHNMKSSYAIKLEDLRNTKWTENNCLTGSVMDYNDININPDESKQGNYYSSTIGPYDYWVIEYGYAPTKSQEELDNILAKSTRPELIFGNDADDMRRPGKAIDPRVMVNDLSNQPVTFALDKIKFMKSALNDLDEKFYDKDEFYEDFRRAYFILNSHYWGALDIISRQIGGIYVDRTTMGQEGAKLPYTPVPYSKQKRAMDIIAQYGFAPDVFIGSEDQLRKLAKQRRGFNFFSGNEDPQMHNYVLGQQKDLLNHLLHKNVLRRLVDSELYGNTYTIDRHLKALNKAIFEADKKGKINTFRQNLQKYYVDQLIKLYEDENFSTIEQTAVFMALKDIEAFNPSEAVSSLSDAHRLLINEKIEEAFENE